jgi:hypothetical protein
MADPSIDIDLGTTLPYLEDRIRALFGKDQASLEAAKWFKGLQITATTQSSVVHCVGMHRPISFDNIYQPTRLVTKGAFERPEATESYSYQDAKARSIVLGKLTEEHSITINDFLANGEDAVIYAGPGWGKTTFLHHIYRRSSRDANRLPVLITLRRHTALQDLERFVEAASKIQKQQHRAKILLLIDGYDELSVPERKRASDSILRYQALGLGNFYLTCRDYYQVFNVVAPEVRIDRFTKQDKLAFVSAFLSSFKPELDPIVVINDLESCGFEELLSHPLLLTLACIAKTSRSRIQARSAIKLLDRAVEVLCYLWDDKKGIDRDGDTPLDGKDRLKIIRKIAYIAQSPRISRQRAEGAAAKQLELLLFERTDPREVLLEIARFYGILVPSDDGYEFVHRTLHDFLAAQYWVETGEFAKLANHEWNSRTAYAACLIEDATSILEEALSSDEGLPTVAEILTNSPSLKTERVADAILKYFSAPDQVLHFDNSEPMRITGSLRTDFIRVASNRLLNSLVEYYSPSRSGVRDVIVGYCLVELYHRKTKLDCYSYDRAIAAYGKDRFTFNIIGVGQVQLGFVKPEPDTAPNQQKPLVT